MDEIVLRNKDFISEKVQKLLGEKTFLVAGCGSVGGSAVELLVRTGARRFILADPDTYDFTNLNRQTTGYFNVGENKARYMNTKIEWVNPNCYTEVYDQGITKENISILLDKSDIVIDGVDVTTTSGWKAKYLLHKYAKLNKMPVISGYDMDATQYIIFYDYRNENEEILHGKILESHIEQLDPLDICLLLIGANNLPLGIIEELERIRKEDKKFISQLGIAATLYGVIAVSMIIQILADNKKIKKEIYLDLWELLNAYNHMDISKLVLEREEIVDYVNMLREKL